MNGRAHALTARVGVPAPGGNHVLRRPLITEVPFGREALLALERDLTPPVRAGADADAAPARDRSQDARVCRRRLPQAERGRAVCGPSLEGNGPERARAGHGVSPRRSNRHEQEGREPGNGSAQRRTNHGKTLRSRRWKEYQDTYRANTGARRVEERTCSRTLASEASVVVGAARIRNVDAVAYPPDPREPHPCPPTCRTAGVS